MKLDKGELNRWKRMAARESNIAKNHPLSGWRGATWDAKNQLHPNGGRVLSESIKMSKPATKVDLMLKLGYDHDSIKERLQLTQERLDNLIRRYRLPRPT